MPGIAIINGSVSLLQNAAIPLTDRGFLFGHAVFETLLVVDNVMIEWDAHYARLQGACAKTRLSCPEESELFKDCMIAVEENKKLDPAVKPRDDTWLSLSPRGLTAGSSVPRDESYCMSLKIIVTGGNHPQLLLPRTSSKQHRVNVYIICQHVTDLTMARRMQGLTLKSFPDERGAFLIGLKSTNYLFHFLCLDKAADEGFDDAIFINRNEEYTEGVTSSFLWFDDQYHVFSTPPEGNCLLGTSILKLERLLNGAHIPFAYQALPKNRTTNCAGCALVSSIRGLAPVKSIDGMTFDIAQQVSFFKFLIELLNL